MHDERLSLLSQWTHMLRTPCLHNSQTLPTHCRAKTTSFTSCVVLPPVYTVVLTGIAEVVSKVLWTEIQCIEYYEEVLH